MKDDQIATLTDNLANNGSGAVTVYSYYTAANYNAVPSDPQPISSLSQIQYPGGQVIRYTYLPDGSLHTLTTQAVAAGPAYKTEYHYQNGQADWIKYTSPGSTVYTTSYQYYENGAMKHRVLPNGVTTDWTYDHRDRVLSITHRKGGWHRFWVPCPTLAWACLSSDDICGCP